MQPLKHSLSYDVGVPKLPRSPYLGGHINHNLQFVRN